MSSFVEGAGLVCDASMSARRKVVMSLRRLTLYMKMERLLTPGGGGGGHWGGVKTLRLTSQAPDVCQSDWSICMY